MKSIYINSVKECLEENLNNLKAFFIFSTDIACRTWADWCVTSGKTKAVAMERFMAWDNFKGSFLRAKKEGKTAVPSLLRKLFIQDFIRKNAEKANDDPLKLKKIIAPEYAQTAGTFADYLSKNLPSLNLWKTRMEQYSKEYGTWDLEDRDYGILYDSYKDFLEKNNLFEPSWIQDVELEETDLEFFIFFPQLLEDFEDYADVFSKAGNVTLCMLPQDIPDPASCEYPDSRSELRQTILQIIDLVQNKKACDWTDISLSVPDLDTYRPYLERELKLYDVPFAIRSGISLTKNCSGRIFESIQNCKQTDFSYDSVRTLLLDECIPWKESTVLPLNYTEDGETIQKKIEVDLTKTRESLIRHGNELHCMFPYEEKDEEGNRHKTDTWLKALHSQRRGHKTAGMKEEEQKDEQEIALYSAIKNCITNFYRKDEEDSSGFETILRSWFQFKDHFINDSDFSSQSNQILSRCIIHLQEMRTLENDFCLPNKMNIPSPYDFFVSELSQKKYTPQTEQNGISIFQYKLSSEACFGCQFVINASQKQIDVQYKKLDFLSSTKRAKLKLLQNTMNQDASKIFAYLYTLSPNDKIPDMIHISSATETFDGFAIPHSCLNVIDSTANLDQSDYLLNEEKWISSGCSIKPDALRLPKKEIESLLLWKKISMPAKEITKKDMLHDRTKTSLVQGKDYSFKSGIEEYTEQIQKLTENNADPKVIEFLKTEKANLEKFIKEPYSTLPKVSARAELENFFPCPRLWTLSRILKLKDDTLDISLIKNYEIGQLNHTILEEFMKEYLGKALPFYNRENNVFMKGEEDVTSTIKKQIQDAADNSIKQFSKSPLVKKLLLIQQEQISDSIYDFLTILLIPYGSAINAKNERQNIAGLGNCTVYGVENKCVISADDGSHLYFGVIDCLLKSPKTGNSENEGWIIIDYKSTSNSIPAAKDIAVDQNGIIKDFQMPMYITLVCGQSEDKQVDASYYYSIRIESSNQKRAVIDRYIKSGTKDMTQQNFEPTLKKLRDYTKDFSEKSTCNPEPYISYDNTDRLGVRTERDCPSCSFKSICRTTYTIANRSLKTKPGAVK